MVALVESLVESRAGAFGASAEGAVPLLNPLSAEESHLRDRLAPGLLRRETLFCWSTMLAPSIDSGPISPAWFMPSSNTA